MQTFSDIIKSRAQPVEKKGRFKVQKVDEDKRLVFGWANVSVDVGGNEVVDLQEDMIDPETLEAAAYKFAELYRDGGEMHERTGTAVMVESVVLTEEKQAAMGLAAGTLPVGWWIGFRVTDDDVWENCYYLSCHNNHFILRSRITYFFGNIYNNRDDDCGESF